MPLYIEDGLSPKIELLGNIFSSIAFGIVVGLSGNCFLLLTKRDRHSNRMQILLFIYVIFMLLCSTWSIFQSVWLFMATLNKRIPTPVFFFFFTGISPRHVGSRWFHGANSNHPPRTKFYNELQIWGCLVLYQDVSRGSRIVIIVLLSFISFASFSRGIFISIRIAHKAF